jgi:hypothetical protein
MRSVLLALGVGAALGTTLGACASPSHPSATAPGGPASDPAGRPTYATPAPSSTGIGTAPTTITGTVVQGAEPSCLILRTTQGEFELLTDRRVSAGAHVVATGRVTHVMSHCMQGTPFQVSTLTVK